MAHYLLTRFDDEGCAVLEPQDGPSLRVPAEWLPAGAEQGTSLTVALEPSAEGVSIVIALDEGADEPEGVNVGG